MVQDFASNPLIRLVELYVGADPASTARALESMPEEEAAAVFRELPSVLAGRVLPHLQLGFAAAMVQHLGAEEFRELAKTIDPRRAAAILMRIPPDAQERLIPHAPKKLKEEARALLIYPEGSVGRAMITNYVSFNGNERVRDAVRKIRRLAAQGFPSSYAYVVDDEDHLVGVINMRDLLLAAEDAQLESIVTRDVFCIHCFTDCGEAGEALAKRRYFAAPVVDSENHILGIVKAEQLIHGVQENMAESLQRMFGGSPDERAFSPMMFSLKKRLPWLHVNLATAFLAAYVVSIFESIIAQLTALAVLLPVVAGQGGNAGAQSLAIVMRGLVMREIPKNRVIRLIAKESVLGLITGTVTGIATGVIAWLWQGNWVLGVVIGLGMIVNLFFAGLSGAAIPIVMRSFGLDPAQCSSIILTTITDVIGFVAFLGFAVVFQSYLV